MADSSFDVVSKVDRQEVDNALQPGRQRSCPSATTSAGPAPRSSGPATRTIVLTAEAEERVQGRARRVQREAHPPRHLAQGVRRRRRRSASGKIYKITGTLVQGITTENAKKITKNIRDEGPKGVKAQIQGDELRVSSKKRDDLQAVISLLKGKDFGIALQFVNYR